MPRLSPSLLRAAHRLSPHAAMLLPVCRSIPSALSELRWIREHVDALLRRRRLRTRQDGREELTARLCRRRGRGEPLQYILGTQPFGGVEIKCRPGVLIPRPETEAYTVHLADLIRDGRLHALSSHPALTASPAPSSEASRHHHPLRILDICTGTGCIPIELVSRLGGGGGGRHRNSHPLEVEALGLDISTAAVLLARANAAHNFPAVASAGTTTPGAATAPTFEVADIFWHDFILARSLLSRSGTTDWDVVTCNPPYISEAGFARDTARSVRVYEPKAANVPPPPSLSSSHFQGDGDEDSLRPEDVFYPRVLHVAAALARARVVLLEVGDLAQARRVARAALAMRGQRHWRRGGNGDGDDDGVNALVGEAVARVDVEIWRDWPDSSTRAAGEVDHVVVGRTRIPIRGSGHGRAVLVRLDYELRD